MNIKLARTNEARLSEMLSKNSRYGSVENIINEALSMFYLAEKKRGFR
ncbi:hypothetical protein PMIT1303_00333 [Prochlorococcus sp. MIT 1303]|nr:hypothetical protein PMIT1303_00333 [Prochlorococcus sp. MIT 1303]